MMKRVSSKWLLIIFAALVLLSAAWIFIVKNLSQDELIAEVYENGRLLYTIDLVKVTESYTIELAHNTVLVERGQISMLSADCPDQICVNQGVIKSGVYPIICLPNKVEIRITGLSELDGVTGR